ncbi:hypothetical protein TWF106_009686 [Orbilia oligospora]|uniref:DUF7918 domain-containing protein n=1 Tax=Orbilia oligospora TaxID=2813651 RepID=A0A7C8UKR1_ORBOL|nr:hypothetical protein TWF106_009686 [Orbilia oligospora]KAF3227279.1 hypothetical protein TWF191_004144 [Orbilia oligospora]
MPSLKGITCSIDIDGVRAEEFGTKVEGSTVTCSIVSQDDKPFSFNFDLSKSAAERHDYSIYADGSLIKTATTTHKTDVIRKSGLIVNGLLERREMRFSKLETGTLKVEIHRAEKRATKGRGSNHDKLSIKDVHEKSLKGRAVSHRTSLGAADYGPPSSLKTKRLDPDDRPYVVFTFRYARKSYLQSEGLIPRSPSPELSIRGGDRQTIDEMSPEALRRELLRYRARDKDEKKAIKRERASSIATRNPAAGSGSDDEVVFQSERSLKKQKITEVIDLLSDD